MRHALVMPGTDAQSGTAEPQAQVPALRATSFAKVSRVTWSRTELGWEVSWSALDSELPFLPAPFFLVWLLSHDGSKLDL